MGDTTALTVSNPDAKEIVFSDPSQLPEDTTFYIVPGDTADFLLTLAADVDPEATFVYCYFDGNQACVLDYAGEGGYAFSSGIDSMETTGYSYADVFVYNSLDPDNALAHIMYFASEENVNEVVASYLSDESGNALVSWQYRRRHPALHH